MRFVALGRALVRLRWVVVVAAAVFFVVAGVIGADVATKLSSGGFEDPGAESTRARQVLDEQFDAGEPNVVLLVRPQQGTVDDPAVAAAGLAVTAELADVEGVTDVTSYWSLGSPPPLRADDASSALVLGRVTGTEDEVDERVGAISAAFDRDDALVSVQVGGQQEAFRQIGEQIESDLKLAELIAFPLTLLLLVFVFRSVVSASLPLLVGGLAIVGTFLVLEVLAGVTTVSIFALNLTTALGLGLAIDYSLLVVSRYREERQAGNATTTAVVRTVATAGRSVLFSGLTVAASLAALLVFPVAFLRSFAYAGIPVVGLAVLGALVVLPAVLALLGDRVDRLALPRRAADPAPGDTFWARNARRVMRRPGLVAAAAVTVLVVLGLPFLHVAFGLPDDRVLPQTASVRQVGEHLRDHYSSNDTGALAVVAPDAEPTDAAAIGAYAATLSTIEGVARVDASTGTYVEGAQVLAGAPFAERFTSASGVGTWLSVVPAVEPISAEGESLVTTIRDLDAPFEVLVDGQSAALVDLKDGIFERLPLALGIIAVATFVLLFLSFGSVLVPVKALVLNLLSLSATFGAMVWIFQDGNLAGPLDVTATGLLDTTTPILMFCIAFGLSMDYEVFLLSRIKEEYDRTGDNTEAVAVGLGRTGRIITAAAALMSVVFLAFATSGVSFIKLFGLGLTLAVLMDATVVRATLVPAFMRLAGPANWWAPAWMRRIYDRLGVGEEAAERAIPDLHDEPGGDAAPHRGARGGRASVQQRPAASAAEPEPVTV
jgi:RND superfamily putative drug exporter